MCRRRINALKMPINRRQYKVWKLIHHSDRGIQYCSDEYQKVLQNNNLEVGMTESYDPYADVVAERIEISLSYKERWIETWIEQCVVIMSKAVLLIL